MRVIIVPRWGGGADCDWIPWLRGELRDVQVDVAPLLPSPGAPEIAPTIAALRTLCEGDPPLIIGHSVGGQAAMRAAETVPVAGLLIVAGWFTIDEPWETIQPWIDTPIDAAAVRRNAGRIRVLLSDDDPYTSGYQAEADRFVKGLAADVTVLPSAKHLNGAVEPAILAAARELLISDRS